MNKEPVSNNTTNQYVAFDRYRSFTDVDALLASLVEPERKSIRVNTLKSSVDELRAWAQIREWKLEKVQWCEEGFFIDTCSGRSRSSAAGRDLLHQLGHFYIQEASSMLPVELLDPKPGEMILDLCAAPGSKTTQMAAKMENTGAIIANDVQLSRLWTLKQNLNRCGVLNCITTNLRGEQFGRSMTEQFDRVLCDAPCSAQGIIRSDPNALRYSPEKRVEKLARSQMSLLESAIHAAKVGGRIVYSTCTLTPEENEGVIVNTLEKFSGKVEIIDVRYQTSDMSDQKNYMDIAIANSIQVQHEQSLMSHVSCLMSNHSTHLPLLRIWPHSFTTDGFFAAVLRKTAPTCDRRENLAQTPAHQPLTGNRERDLRSLLTKLFGVTFIHAQELLASRGDYAMLASKEALSLPLPFPIHDCGMPFLKGLRDSAQIRLTHDFVTLRGNEAKENVIRLEDHQLRTLLEGNDLSVDQTISGDHILLCNNFAIGYGRIRNGMLKNSLPRHLIRQTH